MSSRAETQYARTVTSELVTLRSYAAGLFEGEGCVTITRARTRSGGWQWLLATVVQMGDREPLELLCAEWGGRVYSVPVRGNRRDMLAWRASAGDAARFLADIQPYVLAERRRERIALAIEFQEQKRNHGRCYPPEYLAAQEEYRQRIRWLNRRGSASNAEVAA